MFALPFLDASMKIRTGSAQWFAEAVAAFGLVMTILAGIRFQRNAVPWLVGLYITAAYWFTVSMSFANPAVAIARSFTNSFSGIRPSTSLASLSPRLRVTSRHQPQQPSSRYSLFLLSIRTVGYKGEQCSGGESVSQSPLKDKAFSNFLDRNPPFELRPKTGVPIFSWNPYCSSKYCPNP